MIFFGILIGIGLANLMFLGYLYCQLKGRNVIHSTIQKLESKARPQAKIIMPLTDEKVAQEAIIEGNEEKGQETPLEKLGL